MTQKLDLRQWAALALGIVAVSTPIALYLNYRDAHDALVRARDAETRLCEATNTARRINNRDRALLVRSQQSSKATLKRLRVLVKQFQTPDGKRFGAILIGLFEGGGAQARESIRERPHLALLRCAALKQ